MNCIKLIQAQNLHSSMCTYMHTHVITCMLLMSLLYSSYVVKMDMVLVCGTVPFLTA